MSYPGLLSLVLWLGIEDVSGLWEVVWEMNVRHEAGRDGLNRAAAVGAVFDVQERGWISLYHCHEPYGDLEAVSVDAVYGLLLKDEFWNEPAPSAVSVRFETTDAGKMAYERMAQQQIGGGT